jgi:hypothetical protein
MTTFIQGWCLWIHGTIRSMWHGDKSTVLTGYIISCWFHDHAGSWLRWEEKLERLVKLITCSWIEPWLFEILIFVSSPVIGNCQDHILNLWMNYVLFVEGLFEILKYCSIWHIFENREFFKLLLKDEWRTSQFSDLHSLILDFM